MEATGIFVPRVAGQTSALLRRGQNWDVNAVQGPHSTVLPINRPCVAAILSGHPNPELSRH